MQIILLALLLFASISWGQAHKGLSFQAFIKTPGGTHPTATGLTVNAKILSADDCILLEENYSAVTVNNGYLNLVIGQGTRTGADTGKTLAQVMNNNAGTLTGLTCLHANGTVDGSKTTTTPVDANSRKYRVSFLLGADPILADFNLRSVAYAINSETLEGRRASTFISVNSPQGVNQANLESIFSRYSTLDSILGGSFTGNVTGNVSGTAANVTGVVAIANGGTGATTAADARTNLGLGPLAVMPTTGTASASTFLRGDGQWTAVAPGGVTSVATGTGLTGGPITTSGTISVAAGGIGATELAADSVITAKILDANVTTNKVANLAITDAKINDVAVDKITSAATKYFTYRPNGAACANNEVLKWDFSNSRWICGADAGLTAESDPKVGSNTTNYLSKWSGTALVTSGVFENSGRVGIGNAAPAANLEITGPAGTDPLLVTANGINTLHVTQTSGVRLRNSYTVEYNSGASRTEFGAFDHNYIVSGFGQSDGTPRNINLLPYAGGSVGVGTASPSGVLDVQSANGRQFQVLDGGAGSVNYITATGAATGTAPAIAATGSDTNVALALRSKGTASINMITGGGTQLRIQDKPSAVNSLAVMGGATGQSVNLTATGTDTNVGFDIVSKGTGQINFASNNSVSNSNFKVFGVNSAANYLAVTGAASGSSPVLSANGGDANIDITLSPKGTGNTVISSGNVGIGVLAPIDKLEVGGRVRATHICAADGSNCKDLTTSWGSGGTVTSITAGTGLTGGAITTSGTIGLGAELAGLNALATTGIMKRTGAGTYTAGTLDVSSADFTGVLPIARGGTNSGTALNNNRMITSSGGAIVEMAAMTDGQLIVGKSADAPQIVTMNGDATISNTGAVTLATVPVSKGGTATTSYSANKVIVSNGTGTALVGTSCNLNEVISFDAGGAITCASMASLVGNAFVDGGNTFSATATLGTNSNHDLAIETNNTTKMTVTAGGSVGVGTATPGGLFTVQKGNNSATEMQISALGVSGNQEAFLSIVTKSNNSWLGQAANKGWQFGARGDAYSTAAQQNDLSLSYWNGSTYINPLTIDSLTGHLGIGTTTPARALHVGGPMRITASGAPSTPVAGDIYVDSGDANKLKYYDGSAWVAAGSSGGASLVVAPSTGSLIGGTSGASSVATASLNNTAYGYHAMHALTTGPHNVAVGYLAGQAVTTGATNVAIGAYSQVSNSTGGGNVAIGMDSMSSNTSSHNNVSIGLNSMRSGNGIDNSVAVGMSALYNASGDKNVAIGADSGVALTTGTNNLILGTEVANNTLTTGSSNILIGTSSAVTTPAAGTSNFLNIGNAIFATGMTGTVGAPAGNVGIGTTSPARLLHVAGPMRLTASGAPSTPVAGDIYVDSGDANKLKYYDGSAWVAAGGGGGTGDVLIGGNTVAATMPLGTNSNHDLAIETNGTTKMTVNADGKVGIGTTASDATLEVYETGAGAAQIRTVNNSWTRTSGVDFAATSPGPAGFVGYRSTGSSAPAITGVWLSSYQSGAPVILSTTTVDDSTSERMRISSAGNVGINTTNPGSTLDVKGTLRLSGSTSGYVGFAPAAAAGSTTYTLPSADGSAGHVLKTSGAGVLSWGDADSVPISMTANRLIGTGASGTAMAEVTCSLNQVISFDASGNWTCANVNSLVSGFVDGGNTFTGTATLGSNSNHDLAIETNGTTKMTVKAGGNVGIGTTSPSDALHVVRSGAAFVTVQSTGTNGSGFTASSTSGNNTYNGFYSGGAASGSRQKYIGNMGGYLAFGRSDDAWSTNEDQMVILNSGNVGIGTTTPFYKFTVAGNAAASNLYTEAMVYFNANDTGLSWPGNNATIATVSSTSLKFDTAGSERMRIANTGNVGIGTTSPTVALDVAGGVRAGSESQVTTCGAGAANGEGTQRYNYTTHAMEFCNGTSWVALGSASVPVWKSQIFTSGGTFTTPAGTTTATQFKFTIVGGGGGGSGSGSGVFGTGGGSGAAAIYYGTGVAANTSVTITVGAAGTAGAGGGNGGDGGLSRVVFDGTTVTANGGGGGNYNAAEDAVATATNGSINMSGGRGSYAFGTGGTSLMGAGGPVGVNNAAGTAGSGYGAGGGGGSTGVGHAGGAGSAGIVLVEWVQ